MKIDTRTDKRIIERELHLKGRVLTAELERMAGELPDLSSRIDTSAQDLDQLRENLMAEAGIRNERIRRSLADTDKQNANRAELADFED